MLLLLAILSAIAVCGCHRDGSWYCYWLYCQPLLSVVVIGMVRAIVVGYIVNHCSLRFVRGVVRLRFVRGVIRIISVGYIVKYYCTFYCFKQQNAHQLNIVIDDALFYLCVLFEETAYIDVILKKIYMLWKLVNSFKMMK